jgi:hypothetical protein
MGSPIHVEYFHASKYGNGAQVAEEFKRIMTAKGDVVEVHHIRDAKPTEVPLADLYVFSSPGRLGKPIGGMRRFLRKVSLPPGAMYAILTTEGAAKPDKKTGELPSAEEIAKWQRVRPIMNELLEPKHLNKVGEACVLVTAIKGPLEDGWQQKVEEFAATVSAATEA